MQSLFYPPLSRVMEIKVAYRKPANRGPSSASRGGARSHRTGLGLRLLRPRPALREKVMLLCWGGRGGTRTRQQGRRFGGGLLRHSGRPFTSLHQDFPGNSARVFFLPAQESFNTSLPPCPSTPSGKNSETK